MAASALVIFFIRLSIFLMILDGGNWYKIWPKLTFDEDPTNRSSPFILRWYLKTDWYTYRTKGGNREVRDATTPKVYFRHMEKEKNPRKTPTEKIIPIFDSLNLIRRWITPLHRTTGHRVVYVIAFTHEWKEYCSAAFLGETQAFNRVRHTAYSGNSRRSPPIHILPDYQLLSFRTLPTGNWGPSNFLPHSSKGRTPSRKYPGSCPLFSTKLIFSSTSLLS